MTLEYNPYDYMLILRTNRILFQYLEYCSVHFSDNKGWIIQGESKEGLLEVYELVNSLIRVSIPIKVPNFINVAILSEILLGLQPTIEGLITIDKLDESEDLYLIYSIHFDSKEEQSLDQCLIKFKQEEKQILEGFDLLKKDFEKMTLQLASKNQSLKQGVPGVPNFTGRAPDEDNLDSLWDEIDIIDKSFDEEE